MMLYGVRFLLNLFEMLIYRRFLEAYIGNRRTGLELSVLIMGICAWHQQLCQLPGQSCV